MRKRVLQVVCAALMAGSVVGCGRSQKIAPADLQFVAREKLATALACWAQGESPGECERKHPELSIFDVEWDDQRVLGIMPPYKLLRWEIADGTNLDPVPETEALFQYPVTLTLDVAAGRQVEKSAKYLVSKRSDKRWGIQIRP